MTIRFTFVALALLLISSASARAQKLVLFEDQDQSGYKDARGKVVIPAKFRAACDFSKNNLAAVVDDQGWCYINKKGAVVIRTPFVFDNGADYFKEGLVRVVSSGKIGFADRFGKTIIAPQFDFAEPFSEGLAAVCLGCRSERADADGHSLIVGGRWGFINRRGATVELRFEDAEDFANGAARVRLNSKWKRVDKSGRVLD